MNFASDKELCINYAEGGIASATSSIQKWTTKAKKLAEKYPEEVKLIQNKDGSVYMTFPKEWLRFPQPPRTRNMTKEQKEAMAQRMLEARKKGNQ